MKLFERFRADAKALVALTDWLGEGGVPVNPEVAQRRADTCLSCPKRGICPGLEAAAAKAIFRLIELKSEMGLSVAGEGVLGCCSACGCYMPLKIQMPLDKILKETDDAERAKLHPACWILNETPEMK